MPLESGSGKPEERLDASKAIDPPMPDGRSSYLPSVAQVGEKDRAADPRPVSLDRVAGGSADIALGFARKSRGSASSSFGDFALSSDHSLTQPRPRELLNTLQPGTHVCQYSIPARSSSRGHRLTTASEGTWLRVALPDRTAHGVPRGDPSRRPDGRLFAGVPGSIPATLAVRASARLLPRRRPPA